MIISFEILCEPDKEGEHKTLVLTEFASPKGFCEMAIKEPYPGSEIIIHKITPPSALHR